MIRINAHIRLRWKPDLPWPLTRSWYAKYYAKMLDCLGKIVKLVGHWHNEGKEGRRKTLLSRCSSVTHGLLMDLMSCWNSRAGECASRHKLWTSMNLNRVSFLLFFFCHFDLSAMLEVCTYYISLDISSDIANFIVSRAKLSGVCSF